MEWLGAAERDILWLSLKVGVVAALSALPFALLAAWLLARVSFPGKSLFNALIHVPLVLPPVVVGYLLLLLFGVKGPIGAWLNSTFGIRLVFTTAGAVVASAIIGFPLMVRAIKLSLDGVNRDLEFAARSLGATRWNAFCTITLPLILPGILSGFVLSFATSLGEFGATITFASNIEGETRTLPLAIYAATQSADGDALALRLVTLSMGLAITSLMVSDFLERRARRWVDGSG